MPAAGLTALSSSLACYCGEAMSRYTSGSRSGSSLELRTKWQRRKLRRLRSGQA